ncbi:predicted protein [Histoplasma capsulatum G186AR]|uniref:Uncharacterized protein n=1 Tax=Ajellomyces capsulatus (strain G186AR / H82 / ATCC MYA-2454 / RMSCC 2432) TaxID=447093 RepID=C0NZG7_AJECG|nr:uncharacterized protein HCBG_08547 [Histoplasma capsulatum G186AR]EEH03215.1 predicted protein [Histoplasma capsulatum G186AR]
MDKHSTGEDAECLPSLISEESKFMIGIFGRTSRALNSFIFRKLYVRAFWTKVNHVNIKLFWPSWAVMKKCWPGPQKWKGVWGRNRIYWGSRGTRSKWVITRATGPVWGRGNFCQRRFSSSWSYCRPGRTGRQRSWRGSHFQ